MNESKSKDHLDALRTAVAMARAAQEGDAGRVGELFGHASDEPTIAFWLSKIPHLVGEELETVMGEQIDWDPLWDRIVNRLASLDTLDDYPD